MIFYWNRRGINEYEERMDCFLNIKDVPQPCKDGRRGSFHTIVIFSSVISIENIAEKQIDQTWKSVSLKWFSFVYLMFFSLKKCFVKPIDENNVDLVTSFLVTHLWTAFSIIWTPGTWTITSKTDANEWTHLGVTLKMSPNSSRHHDWISLLLIGVKTSVLVKFSLEKY